MTKSQPKFKVRPSTRTSWRQCPRKVFFRVEAGIEPARTKAALVIGSSYHTGIEEFRKTQDSLKAAVKARGFYLEACQKAGIDHDPVTAVQVGVYVKGYAVHYGRTDGEMVLCEVPVFDERDKEQGTCDAVVKRPDGGVYVLEDKTTSRFDDAESMSLSLKLNDQIATYVHALRRKKIPVSGVFYRQCLKTGTSVTKKETIDDYERRITEVYCAPHSDKYREFSVSWTEAELVAIVKEAQKVNRQIAYQLGRKFESWPYNPLSCIGAFGPCEYLRLCSRLKDSGEARLYKPTEEGARDGGSFQRRIWSEIKAVPEERGTEGGGEEGGVRFAPEYGEAGF